MYMIKEITKNGVVLHHGPFITMKGMREFQQQKFDAASKTTAHNLWAPKWEDGK